MRTRIIGRVHGGGLHFIAAPLLALLLGVWLGASGTPARAASFFAGPLVPPALTGAYFGDIANNPNEFSSWDLTTITYKFDPSFLAAYPNPGIEQQIRLAFQQWDDAFATPLGPTYGFSRANGFQAFGDIRSIATHEIGHVLGFGHPDQAAGSNLNFQLSGSTWSPGAPVGSEVMRSWINPGDYNHVLSQDELQAFGKAYGHDLNFVEVTGSTPANILITTYTNVATNWAQGPPTGALRNTADSTQGTQITSGEIFFNTSSGNPLGYKTKGINWDYTNASGLPVSAFVLRTTGTNNPTPVFHYDNNGAHQFLSFSTAAVGSSAKDDLVHTWSVPSGGAVPAGEILHVGIEQDVWDWSAVSAQTRAPDGTLTSAQVMSFHEWSNTIVEGTPAASVGISTLGTIRVLARGIEIQAPDIASLLSNLAIANVDGMGLELGDLNRDTLGRLIEEKLLQPIPNFGERQMDPFASFFLVLQGSENDLPPDILEKGNFMLLDRPDLLDHELFVYGQSDALGGTVGTYALLGTPVIVPEPGTALALLLPVVLLRRRRFSR